MRGELSTGVKAPPQLSTGCVEDLWMSELIIPIPLWRLKNSRPKPSVRSLSGVNDSLHRVDQWKRVDEEGRARVWTDLGRVADLSTM